MSPSERTNIAAVRAEVVDIALHAPFAIAGGSQSSARIVVVSLRLEDGTTGLGEAAPLQAYDGETVEMALQTAQLSEAVLRGLDARRWRHVCERITETCGSSRAARCALETALLDALCQQQRTSFHHWFGGSAKPELTIDVTIPLASVDEAARSAREWASKGFDSLKIKLGGSHDLERVLAVHDNAPQARLMLDANASLEGESAVALWRALQSRGVTPCLFEQPVAADDWDGLSRVMAAGARVALDESVATASELRRAVERLGPGFVINIKLMKSGIAEALSMVATAKASGVSLMIGGMLESSLAMTTSACFATGLGGFEFVDLDTHLFLRDSPLSGGLQMSGAVLSVAGIEQGHGVRRGSGT